MSADAELDSFIVVLDKQLTAVRRAAPDPSALDPELVIPALESVGVLDLALDTVELDNSLEWLSSVIRTCARFSPSIAFALASRFAGQRATRGIGALSPAAAVAGGDGGAAWRATVPGLFAPQTVVLLNRAEVAARVVTWDVGEIGASVRRTGLIDADLRTVTDPAAAATEPTLTGEQARIALFELDLLNASVGLGLIENAVATSEDYAANRRQFGQPVATFAGLAAILVEMRLRSSIVAGLLTAALGGQRDGAELVAVTGRAGVEVCLDAIQVHGGYGYIDEYPVAGMLRDAISLRARGGGRRAAVAAVAAAHLPSR
ncbi:acyl-CoA dehydrogenase-like protein [Kribbella sp. VKM Ac-2527]|uniref:Acyl-CoA dehydrogenase-like protein n=1 Tax=Kribbella caucasensis TaxID=2512215 RepID=A0A4R6KLJ3_9ACTN|nr:acyl-CoA dehydrogenase family protein [Kribbella sp. VKM Ac-2527]TDO51656.1 acyl-CoA dehydrogenase-like protein [Kribbella sp. VKM Ac-2527]